MKLRTFFYCMKQGILNIGRNRLFSLASTVTIAACVFLFGIFYMVVMNLQYMAQEAENNVGITVFFEQGLEDARIEQIGQQIESRASGCSSWMASARSTIPKRRQVVWRV